MALLPVDPAGLQNPSAFELRNPSGVQPKLNIVPIDHSFGTFLCGVVVDAVEVDSLDVITLTSNQERSIMCHH
jgi:hypothetical protein